MKHSMTVNQRHRLLSGALDCAESQAALVIRPQMLMRCGRIASANN